MIPSAFVMLEAMPLTPSGKIDRQALPEPKNLRPDLGTPYVQPRTLVEGDLANIWADVLALTQVGVHDNFFDLGGHSLAATRVVSRVIQQFQIDIPLQSVFQSPTVADVASVITAHQGKKLGESQLKTILDELASLSDADAQQLVSQINTTITPK
jgi:acyl carrier protein